MIDCQSSRDMLGGIDRVRLRLLTRAAALPAGEETRDEATSSDMGTHAALMAHTTNGGELMTSQETAAHDG